MPPTKIKREPIDENSTICDQHPLIKIQPMDEDENDDGQEIVFLEDVNPRKWAPSMVRKQEQGAIQTVDDPIVLDEDEEEDRDDHDNVGNDDEDEEEDGMNGQASQNNAQKNSLSEAMHGFLPHPVVLISKKMGKKCEKRGKNGGKPKKAKKCIWKCKRAGCIFTARTAYSLKEHTRTHTGKKPYKCRFCSDSFTQASGRQKHERTHTKARPYQCNICDKRFTQRAVLTVHLRTHTGEKPYTCQFCSITFANVSNRNTHQRVCQDMKEYRRRRKAQ